MLFLVFLFSSLSSFHQTEAQCTFPSDLTGVWESPIKGNLTFNTSHVEGYQIYTGSGYTEMTFECHLNSDNYYVIRSENFTVLGGINVVNAVTCMDLTQQSSTKYTYYLKTTTLNDAKFERVMFIAHDATVSLNEVCNETATVQEVQLLISYGTGVSGAIQCPNAILGTYYYYNHGTCTASSWDVCADLTKMTFNYTQCSDIMAFSVSGEVYCQYYLYSGSTAIFYVYNTDTSVNNSVNYQFTCLMAEIANDGFIYTSMFPSECLPNMTTTYVASGGKTQVLGANITCVPTNDSSEETANAGLIAGLVILFVVLIIGGAVGGYFYFTKKKKVSPNVIDKKEKSGLSSSRSDPVTPSVVDPQIKSPPQSNGSHGKKFHKRIAIKRVERRSIFTPPADTKSPTPYKRLTSDEMTLITPRTLKALKSVRKPATPKSPYDPPPSQRSTRARDHRPKVNTAPVELRLELPENLTRENTAMSVISRATTVNEENIGLKLLSEKSILEERKAEKEDIKSVKSFGTKNSALQIKPSSRRNRRNISMSVKPLNKGAAANSKRTRVKVQFKDTTGVYRKNKVTLVGKRQAPKRVKLDDITAKSLKVDEQKRPVSKESMYGFDLVKELNRPSNRLKLKTPKKQDKPKKHVETPKPEINNSHIIDDGDSNFFMCSNHEEDQIEISEVSNLTDSLKLSQMNTEPKSIKSIVENNRNSAKHPRTPKKRNKINEKWNFVKEIERMARTSFVKPKKPTTESNILIKAKKEAVIEQKVLTKIYYNYDFKTKSKIKQRKRRNKRTVDLSKVTNFARIPTLINWVEYTNILATPAMAKQKQINEKNAPKQPEGEIANQKYII